MTHKEWLGVYIARENPIHAGHENVKNIMIQERKDQCMLVLWSINEDLSWRNMFSYEERVKFIKMIYPELLIQWICDFKTDDAWIFALKMIIKSRYNWDIKNVVFYWWCDEDIAYLLDRWMTCKVVNRFDGVSSPKISATEIRDILHKWYVMNDIERTKKTLWTNINPIIQDELISLFGQKVAMLKKM